MSVAIHSFQSIPDSYQENHYLPRKLENPPSQLCAFLTASTELRPAALSPCSKHGSVSLAPTQESLEPGIVRLQVRMPGCHGVAKQRVLNRATDRGSSSRLDQRPRLQHMGDLCVLPACEQDGAPAPQEIREFFENLAGPPHRQVQPLRRTAFT